MSREAFVRGRDSRSGVAGLTAREEDILAHVARGMGNEAIAAALGISIHTVRSHLRAVFFKTGSRNRTAAAIWYARSFHA